MCEIIHRDQNRQDLQSLRWVQKSEAQILFANQALRGSYRAAVLANLADERENRRSPAILLNIAQGPGMLDPRASPPPQSPPRHPRDGPRDAQATAANTASKAMPGTPPTGQRGNRAT